MADRYVLTDGRVEPAADPVVVDPVLPARWPRHRAVLAGFGWGVAVGALLASLHG